MNFDDIGELSSFSSQPKEKGLLTFYQEQWDSKNQQSSIPVQKEIIIYPKILTPKILTNKLNTHNYDDVICQKSRFSFSSDKNKKKTYKSQESFPIKEPKILLKKAKVFHPTSFFENTKQKQNRTECIKKNLFQNIQTYSKIKKERHYQSVHIKNYPFSQEQDDDSTVSKLKGQISNIRIRKRSSFKGFHRQNILISSIGLSKQFLNEVKKQIKTGISIKSENNQYQGYSNISSKNVSSYLFPIMNQNICFLKKKLNDADIIEYEDSLNQLCRQMKIRQHRNSQIPLKGSSHFS